MPFRNPITSPSEQKTHCDIMHHAGSEGCGCMMSRAHRAATVRPRPMSSDLSTEDSRREQAPPRKMGAELAAQNPSGISPNPHQTPDLGKQPLTIRIIMLDVFPTRVCLDLRAPLRARALLVQRNDPLVHLLPPALAVLDLRPLPPRSAGGRHSIDLVLDHAREVDHGRDRAEALLRRDGGVVRRRRVEPAVGEREEEREEAERRGEDEVAERLGDDAPHEDRQDT